MVNVLGVEQGKQLLTVSVSLPVQDVLALVSSAAGIPEDELLIFNCEGVLLDPKRDLSSQTLEDSDLFAIRNNNVNCTVKAILGQEDWRTFKDFPAHDAYEEPFSFEGIDLIEAKTVLEDERLLFTLTQRARQSYALYITHLRLYDEIATMLEIRAKACPVLLKSIKLYYKQVKYHFGRVRSKLEKLKNETLANAQSYKSRLKELMSLGHLSTYVEQLLKDPAIKNYGKRFASLLRSLENKLSEVETLLKDSKKSVGEKMNRAKNRANTLSRFTQIYFRSETREKEPQLAQCLQVCAVYRKLRMKLNKAVKSPGGKRVDTGLTDSEDEVDAFQDKVEDGERIVAQLDEFGRQEKEESTRISVIFREVVAECADKASRLKLRGKDKLDKIEKRIATLEIDREMLDFPRKFPNSCEAAICEIERRKATGLYLADMYSEICSHILVEAEHREDFLRTHGDLLPAQVFPELEVSAMPKSVLRKVLKTEETRAEAGPSLFGELDERFKRAILHYEGELKQAEIRRVQDLNELQTKCSVLERDIQELSSLISRVTQEKQEMHTRIRTCSSELGKLREEVCGSQLRQLKSEIDKLQKKEAAFKEGWVEQVQTLESEVRHLRARERKRSRPDLSELS